MFNKKIDNLIVAALLFLALTINFVGHRADAAIWGGATPPPAGAGGVTSVTGDGVLIGNSLSTGAVTLTQKTAAANTMLGNWTSGAANPAFNSMPACTDTGGNHLNYVAGTGITCGTSSGAAGALTMLSTVNASAAASVTFSSTYITSTYKIYVVKFYGVFSSSANDNLLMTISTDNGSTYLSTGYTTNALVNSSNGTPAGGTSSTTNINLTTSTGVIGTNSTGLGLANGSINIYQPSNSVAFSCDWTLAANQTRIDANGHNSGTTAINNIKFTMATGNTSGTFVLYGLN